MRTAIPQVQGNAEYQPIACVHRKAAAQGPYMGHIAAWSETVWQGATTAGMKHQTDLADEPYQGSNFVT